MEAELRATCARTIPTAFWRNVFDILAGRRIAVKRPRLTMLVNVPSGQARSCGISGIDNLSTCASFVAPCFNSYDLIGPAAPPAKI